MMKRIIKWLARKEIASLETRLRLALQREDMHRDQIRRLEEMRQSFLDFAMDGALEIYNAGDAKFWLAYHSFLVLEQHVIDLEEEQ